MKRWTARGAMARSRRQLDAAVGLLRKVSAEWDEVDNTISWRAEEMIRDLEEFRDSIQKDITERLDAGEQVGL